LHDTVARLEVSNIAAGHSDILGQRRTVSVDLHDPFCPLRQAGVSNFYWCRIGVSDRHEIDQTMHALPGTHESIAQIRVLVQDVRLPSGATEPKLVLMIAFMHVRSRVKHRLQHDLRRRAAEVEYSVRRSGLWRVGADGIHEVVGRHPREHALVATVHNRNGVLRRERERVRAAEAPPHRLEDLTCRFRA
jgi:hypothetical protein